VPTLKPRRTRSKRYEGGQLEPFNEVEVEIDLIR